MSQLTFKLLDNQSKSGIYKSTDTTNEGLTLYYLSADQPSEDTLEFSTIWAKQTGYYFFLQKDTAISDEDALANSIKTTLGVPTSGVIWLSWIESLSSADEATFAFSFSFNFSGSGGTPTSTNKVTANFLTLNMVFPSGINLTTDDTVDNPILSLQSPVSGSNSITLNGDGNSNNLIVSNDEKVNIPLTGGNIGVLSFASQWDKGSFYNIFKPKNAPIFDVPPSGEIRFQYNEDAQNIPNFRYPAFIGQNPSSGDSNSIFLNTSIDALNPLDGSRTRFAFDLSKFTPEIPLPSANSLRNNSGSTLYMKPLADPSDTSNLLRVAGFGIGNRPNKDDNNASVPYLVPIGNYGVESSEETPKTAGVNKIMCGLVGTEFLLTADGDILEFKNQNSSFATEYHPSSTSNKDTVENTYTTSWLKLIPGPNSASVFKGPIKESYCVQAPDSVYYSPGQEEGFSLATGVRLASLENPENTKHFPMVPYGSVYYTDQEIQQPINDTVAKTLTSFEYDVLSSQRRSIISPDLCNGPIFFNSANGEPLKGGFVRSPIGLLAELNDGTTPENTPAGTLKRILLAKSPVNEDQFMQFTAGAPTQCTAPKPQPTVVSPVLSTSLMHNSVFLVANQNVKDIKRNLGNFDNKLQLGEFTYEINLSGEYLDTKSAAGDKLATVMIFKFSTTQTVADLAKNTNAWTNKDDFIGGLSVDDVAKQITNSITDAQNRVDNDPNAKLYFQDFLNKVNDPKWTGMLVLNCELDYQALPTDIQVLLGGIDGELVAHHFGITVNQVKSKTDDPTTLDIDNSSLFSLIYYDKEYEPIDINKDPNIKDFKFQVTKLNVLYTNSVMAQFQSQIAMTIQELYGDKVSLKKGGPKDKPEYDAMLIDGVYLKDGESGHIVFDSTIPRYFEFNNSGYGFRVLDNVVITDATLIPISSTDNGSGTTVVKAAFRLNGEFGFNTDVSTNGSKVDLFSYAINSITDPTTTTLNFTNNSLDWDTNIVSETAKIQYPIVSDLTNLKLNTNSTQPRDGSLVATFPLNLVDFNWSPSGLSASSIGAKQITGDPSLSVTLGQGNAPNFSLVFNLNMGNLGMLTSGTALQSTVYLGWSSVGSSTASDNDMSLLFVPPAEFSAGNGGFKLQGIIDTVYGELILNRLPVDDSTGSPLLFVLSLTNIQFSLLSINLLPGLTDGQKPRILTLFGDPNKPQGSNLSWFLSNPNERKAPVDFGIVYPQAGIMNGISIHSDFTGTQVISNAIKTLEGVIYNSDADVIKDIKSGVGKEGFSYDPKAGVLFFLDLQFVAFNFQVLLADPSFYGGLIKIGKQKKGTFLEKWSDFEIELDYRKISDGLGVISVHFTIPKAFRTIPNAEAPTSFTFPAFGLNIYTNGDWKIEVGWPFPSDNNAKIAFVLYGVPVFVGIGLYLAKLRGADVPGTFPESFKLIWMFGLGLSFGIEKEYPVEEKGEDGKEKPKGVISASFTLYIWASFQGMLVSETGSITDNGVDYQWWTTTLGVNLNIEGKVDLKIISVALEVEATIYITFALETGHQTVVDVGADFSVKLTVKILFIKIHISFSHHFDLAHWTWGSGPPALASGPTPCALDKYKGQPGCPDSAGEIVHAAAPTMMAMEEPMILDVTPTVGSAVETTAKEASPTPITVYYLLQPAVATKDDGTDWNPYAVSSLVIQMDPSNNGSKQTNSTTQFSTLLSVLANYIVTLIPSGTGTDLTSILNAMSVVVHSDEFFDESDSFLATDIVFTIDKSSSLTSDTDSYAILPMFSQCKITYNGNDTSLNSPTVPSNYVEAVQDYFDHYMVSNDPDNLEMTVQVNEEISVEEMFVKDYFVMLAQQLVYELGNTLSAATPPTTIAEALAMANNSNIAGFVSQFMLQGLRLPTFTGSTINISNDDWVGIYSLAGLQTQLVTDNKGDYITTFTLGLSDSSASSYIKFAGKDNPTSLTEDFPTSNILDKSPSTTWLDSASGGGISILNPLAASQKTYNLQQPKIYTDNTNTSSLFPLPNAMQKELEQLGSLVLDLSLISNDSTGSSQDSNVGTAVNGTPALFIPLTINKVALPDSNDSSTYYKDTYAIKGTDQFTRELLELLLKQFDSSSTLTLMINTGKSQYVAPSSTDNIVLVKNNLSTDAEPENFNNSKMLFATDFDESTMGPVQATLSDVEDFLRLIWEESIVKTAGYYLHLEKMPDAAFTGESATIALLIGDGSTAKSEITLKNYHNLIDINQSLDKGALAAAVKTSSGDAIQVYQPNYGPGSTGFSVKWLNANPEPEAGNTTDYATSLYRTVQFIIDDISGTTPPSDGYYWSKPNAAKREPGTQAGKDNWVYRQTIPAYQFVDKTNPYAAIGKDVSLEIRVLDMYGNALPKSQTKDQTTTIVYNDPISTFNQLQWLKVAYCVDSKSGAPVLEIDFDFDTDTVQQLINSGSDDGKTQVQQALAEYNKAIGQYSDANASLTIQTSLSGTTFTKDGNNDGTLLKTSVINYLTSVAVYLQDVLGGKTVVDPGTKVLSLNLDFDFVQSIENTVFVVNVIATISRTNTSEDVTKLLPSVGSVSIPIAPFVTPGSGTDTTDTPSLSAFANQFELAYDGFDGAKGQLKIGTGNDFSAGLQNVQENAIWAMKWSVPNGMAVSIKDGTLPSFYAPVPLATSLITRNEDVIVYNSTWNGTSSDIDKTIQVNFANIDMNIWASQFLTTFHDFITPEMAAAIAKLDDTTYDSLMANKNTLAEAIANTIDLIIEPDSGTTLVTDYESAKERMLQSLLASLANDYGTSALVQMPTDVTIVGQVEPNIDKEYPPTLFGKISATMAKDTKAGDKSDADTDKDTPYTVSNAYLPLVDDSDNENKSQFLNFMVAAKHPEDQKDLNLDLLYDIGFINHQFDSSEDQYGYVPSSWMTVVLPERLVDGAQPPALLQIPMNDIDIPIPLRTFPASPSFNSQTAKAKEADKIGQGDQPSIKDFIDWTYTIQVSRTKAAQDDLHLEVSFNENIDGTTSNGALKSGIFVEGRPAPTDLFEALARFSYEYPEVASYLEKIPDAAFNGTDVDVAKAALSRMTELIDGVANTWSTWKNPSEARKTQRLAALAGGTSTTTITPIDQTYIVNFTEDGKTITITGKGYKADNPLPLSELPYPTITGYTSDLKPVDNVVTYTVKDEVPDFIEMLFTDLNIGTHQSGIARAYVERNADIAPEHFTTNEKFIFHTPVVSFKTPIVPLIEEMQPIKLPEANTLTEVISQFFNDFLGDNPADSVVKELRFTLEVGAEFMISSNASNPEEQTLVSTTPILFSQTAVSIKPSNTSGTPATTLAQYESTLVSQILDWHNNIHDESGSPTQMLNLSFTLFADVSESKLPLLRLGQLEIVPSSNDDSWWK